MIFFFGLCIRGTLQNSHLKHVETILKLLEENKFYANKSNEGSRKKGIELLGHIISLYAIKVDPKKIRVITKWLFLKLVTSLKGFLALTSYYIILVRNYAKIVSTLTSLIKMDAFTRDKDEKNCFEQLKTLMTSTCLHAI